MRPIGKGAHASTKKTKPKTKRPSGKVKYSG